MTCPTCNDVSREETCGCEGGGECPCCGIVIIAEADELDYNENNED
jgi:hypothetical protein